MFCVPRAQTRPLLARETLLSWGCKAEKSWVLVEKGRVLFYCCFVPFLKAQVDQSNGLFISWLVQAAV